MRSAEIWIFIFIIGVIGLNWPVLDIFHTYEMVYLFGFWLLFILTIAFAAHRNKRWESGVRK